MPAFKGYVTKGGGVDYYTLRYNGDIIPCCLDVAREMEVPNVYPSKWKYYVQNGEFGWGYGGIDPEILAMTLLGFYCGFRMTGAIAHCIRIPCHIKLPHYGALKFIKEHFKAFSDEVIANLPDNWTMTMEDIDKWVKEKEKS